MQPGESESEARRVRVRNRLLLIVFLMTLAIMTVTNPLPERLRPVLFAVMLTMLAKLIIEFAIGLPMSFLTSGQLQPSERPARVRVLVGALGMVALTLYVFYSDE